MKKNLTLLFLLFASKLVYFPNSTVSAANLVTVTWTGTADSLTPPPGITVSGLETGSITIDGTPTQVGTFTFTITTIGSDACEPDTITGTITVNPPLPMTFCNDLQPGWGNIPLGATFASTNEWTILGTDGRPTQIWSDAVVATACANRTMLATGGQFNVNADCRNSVNNNNFTGHYFSWCAVMRFADELCPAPWRVPSREDFIDLDLNLGGTGANRNVAEGTATGAITLGYFSSTAANSPQSRWGGARFTGLGGQLGAQNSRYWSSTETIGSTGVLNNAFHLHFNVNSVNPQEGHGKTNAMAVRCVRN
ncbi:MAG: fibrobacter succinogenes major paralogous domain-containing protein [Bacteroidales bacterium]|nr:fibrobacter succinogenes major paralogous domain-containing protein [Bacteroidales bacterium]